MMFSLDIMACGALRSLWEKSVSVPEQIAIVGCDNTTVSKIYMPQLTTIDTVLMDCSVTIAHQLTDCIEGRETNHKTILSTNFIQRETT